LGRTRARGRFVGIVLSGFLAAGSGLTGLGKSLRPATVCSAISPEGCPGLDYNANDG
jgi:hypothetical protein